MNVKIKISLLFAVKFVLCVFIMLQTSQSLAADTAKRSAKAISFSTSSSGFLFDTAVYYGQSKATANPSAGNEWNNTTSIYDIKLGYIFDGGLFLGAEYSTRNESSSSSLSGSTTGNAAAVGAGIFGGSGFYLRGYYRMNEAYGDYKNGFGPQGDFGYMLNISSNFYLGLLVSYRQVTFTQNNTIAGFDHWTRSETYPFVSLGFLIN